MLDLSNSEDESVQESEEEIPDEPIFQPQVESIHSLAEEEGTRKFYVKFKGKSFRHCQWLEESELLAYDPQIKNKLNRFVRDFDSNVSRKNNFFLNYDSAYLDID